ncbi:DNA methylase [Candidatus Parcubacteria bacterium]|nr:MAG: DNA methylase [Candidatus Parcubacteria bacterium]
MKNLKYLARNLRNNSTLSEVLLWNNLKARKLGPRFLRQKQIFNYIVDFYCAEYKLIIEIDGASHGEKEEKDKIRQDQLEKAGYRILRFNDSQVKKDIDGVLRAIQIFIEEERGKR